MLALPQILENYIIVQATNKFTKLIGPKVEKEVKKVSANFDSMSLNSTNQARNLKNVIRQLLQAETRPIPRVQHITQVLRS